MSRTIRRTRGDLTDLTRWVLSDYSYEQGCFLKYFISPNSPEGRTKVARYHSDAYRTYKEPGPSWFRTEFTQRPYRQRARNELRKACLNQDYEVLLEPMPYLEYWT